MWLSTPYRVMCLCYLTSKLSTGLPSRDLSSMLFSSRSNRTESSGSLTYCSTTDALSLSGEELDTWMFHSGANEPCVPDFSQQHITGWELFDMTIEQLRSLLCFTVEDILHIITCASKSSSSEAFPYFCKHLERKNAAFTDGLNPFLHVCSHQSALLAGNSIFTMVGSAIKPPTPADSDLPDLHAPYTVANPRGLFLSSSWLLSVASLQHFRTEQYTGQRRALQELLFLAARHAPARGLVEPVLVFNPRNATLYEHLAFVHPTLLAALDEDDASGAVHLRGADAPLALGIYAAPMGGLLDMTVLARCVGRHILPFRDFAALARGALGDLIIADPRLTGRQEALSCPPIPATPEPRPGSDDRRAAPAAAAAAELLGLNWTVRRRLCADGNGPEPVAQALAESRAQTLGVAYTKGRLAKGRPARLQWQAPEFRYLRFRTGLRFTAQVWEYALAYLRREFEGLPFLGVHWRRGDRLFYNTAELAALPATVVAQALAACAEHDLTHVYLMTNCGTTGDLEAVLGELSARGLVVGRLSALGGWAEEHLRVTVESALLSLSEHVLVSPSGVSSTIVEERLLLGYPPHSWGHIVPGTFFSAAFDDIVTACEREIEADSALGAAVRAQAGVGRRTLECAQEPAEPLARCAGLAMDSARDVAERIWPPPLMAEAEPARTEEEEEGVGKAEVA